MQGKGLAHIGRGEAVYSQTLSDLPMRVNFGFIGQVMNSPKTCVTFAVKASVMVRAETSNAQRSMETGTSSDSIGWICG
jgi:hypothetical protein